MPRLFDNLIVNPASVSGMAGAFNQLQEAASWVGVANRLSELTGPNLAAISRTYASTHILKTTTTEGVAALHFRLRTDLTSLFY